MSGGRLTQNFSSVGGGVAVCGGTGNRTLVSAMIKWDGSSVCRCSPDAVSVRAKRMLSASRSGDGSACFSAVGSGRAGLDFGPYGDCGLVVADLWRTGAMDVLSR